MRGLLPVVVCSFLVPLLAAPGAEARTPECRQPGRILEELLPAVRDGVELGRCNWRLELDPSFNSWRVGGSENLPVIAAAVELALAPPHRQARALAWWQTFLEAQLDGGSAQLPERLRYFKGSEPMSNVYDAPVTAAVAVARWRALQLDRPRARRVAALAERYLRATFYLYALAAADGPAATGFRNDRKQPLGNLHRKEAGWTYTGPFVALAGARSNALHFGWDPRGPLLARALDIPFHGSSEEPPEEPSVGELLDWLESAWTPSEGAGPYGLTADERRALRRLPSTQNLPPQLHEALGGLATITAFHIAAWDGVRVSWMERNYNSNTQTVLAVGYWRDPRWTTFGREVQFLYPWTDVRGRPRPEGIAALDEKQRRIEAVGEPGRRGVRRSAHLELPSGPPAYYVVLGRDRELSPETPRWPLAPAAKPPRRP